jgi:hypothetical protein
MPTSVDATWLAMAPVDLRCGIDRSLVLVQAIRGGAGGQPAGAVILDAGEAPVAHRGAAQWDDV